MALSSSSINICWKNVKWINHVCCIFFPQICSSLALYLVTCFSKSLSFWFINRFCPWETVVRKPGIERSKSVHSLPPASLSSQSYLLPELALATSPAFPNLTFQACDADLAVMSAALRVFLTCCFCSYLGYHFLGFSVLSTPVQFSLLNFLQFWRLNGFYFLCCTLRSKNNSELHRKHGLAGKALKVL